MGFEPILCVRLVPVIKAIMSGFPANIYFLKVNNRNTRKKMRNMFKVNKNTRTKSMT